MIATGTQHEPSFREMLWSQRLIAVRFEIHHIESGDGTPLYVRSYRSIQQESGRHLLIVHGLGEHGERYEHFAGVAARRGWNVYALDLRGHGRSGGVHTHISSFGDYVEDIRAACDRLELPAVRTALFGHSMGGLASIRFVQTHSERVSMLALSSPLLRMRVPVPKMKLLLGRVCSWVHPKARFRSDVDPSHTTSNPEVLDRRLVDPLMHRTVTAGWFFSMVQGLADAHAEAEKVGLPLMILQAGNDEIVDPQAAGPWFHRVGSHDKTLEILHDHLHEIINEPDWQETAATYLNWMEARLPAGVAV